MFSDINRCIELGTVIMTTSGGTPSRKREEYYVDGTIKWVKSKELLGSYIVDTEEKITESAINNSSAKLLPPHSILIAMYGVTVGAYAITTSEMTCNQAICALLQNEQYPYTYLYQIAKESQQNFINMAVGSAQQNISQVLIKQLMIHDSREIISEFHSIALPIHQKLEQLTIENEILRKLRDGLLQKLISGEIDVSQIDL